MNIFYVALIIILSSCTHRSSPPKDIANQKEGKPFSSRYQPQSHPHTLIYNVTLLDGLGGIEKNAYIEFKNGIILNTGKGTPPLKKTKETNVIDGKGKWLTPGIIDIHSHLGVYSAPNIPSTADGNEMTSPVTSNVWAEHSVWPQDPQFAKALAGGVTSLLILPGSGNLIGGRGVVLKNVAARTVMEMKFPEAPHALKMACGENPKRVYGEKGSMPSTRMGNMAKFRETFIGAKAYLEKLKSNNAMDNPESLSDRDLKNETLALALNGDITIHVHCYRADEMAQMIELAKEFDFKIASFHHAVEAYKIRDMLRDNKICASVWADWWGFKLEAYDMIPENALLIHQSDACSVIHSDSEEGIQRLNQEAAKSIGYAKRINQQIEPADLITWITSNPAKALGIFEKTGSIESDKMADLVLWNQNPFSVYAKAEKVWIDGTLYFDNQNNISPLSDFMLGQDL